MKLPTLLIIFFLPIHLLLSQKLNSMQTDFPEGIYTTMQDFINRKPNYNFEITKKGTHSLNNELVDDNEQFCFFFEKSKDSKIRKAFAIVYHQELYFKLGSIMKYSEKGDGTEYNPLENMFTKVLFEGDHYIYIYIYTEAVFGNVWTKTAFDNGLPISGSKTYKLNNLKGVVWDVKNKKFNIFKDCIDYNAFIKEKAPEYEQNCDKDVPNIDAVRESMLKII